MRNKFSGNPARRKTSSIASAQPGTLDACFEHGRVPRHQTGSSETEGLPERKVPWHYGEYDSQRVKGDEALACLDGHRLAREEAFGMLRVEVTSQCAFLRLGGTIAHRLAHLLCHQTRVFAGVGT